MSKTDKNSVEKSAPEKVVSSVLSATYMENYKVLSDAAQELREQEVVDIDKLVPIVDKALAAYSACKSRIEAVEALLSERLGGLDE